MEMNDRYLMTLDVGTTNTRLFLWDGDQLADRVEASVGVRNTATEGDNRKLMITVSQAFYQLLSRNDLRSEEISCIVASGMVTSELGLYEVPHLETPVSLEKLAASMVTVSLPDVVPVPMMFIPGIKNRVFEVSLASFEEMDMMRGEETEIAAILPHMPAGEEAIIILPGSHTKFVRINDRGEIVGCLTTMAGEMLASLTNHSVLSDALRRRYASADDYDASFALEGYRVARKVGLSRAAFSGRILRNFAGISRAALASYIMGAVFSEDIEALKNSAALSLDPRTTIIICGRSPQKEALRDILQADGSFSKVEALPESDAPMSAEGARYLYHLASSLA